MTTQLQLINIIIIIIIIIFKPIIVAIIKTATLCLFFYPWRRRLKSVDPTAARATRSSLISARKLRQHIKTGIAHATGYLIPFQAIPYHTNTNKYTQNGIT